MNRSKITLFDYSLYDYLDELTSDNSLDSLTNSKFKLEYASFDDIKPNKSSDYKLKLLLTKKILMFSARKNGVKSDER